jgi:hypothetical protein
MLDRIRQLLAEAHDLLSTVIGYDIAVELALDHLVTALDDLEAIADPSDADIELVFEGLIVLRDRMEACMIRLDPEQQFLVENTNDQINIFLFRHRL